MATSYAVKWREPDGKDYLGRLEFQANALLLDGRESGSASLLRRLAHDELGGFHLGRNSSERLDGRPALVVNCGGEDYLITSAVMHAGVLQEIVHRLSDLHLAGGVEQ
jgi:hypothetical protein